MNKILQEKIDEAAKKYNARAYSPFDDPYELSREFERDCYCFKEGANFALNHQWISTSESLPPLDEVSSNGSVGVIARTSECVVRYAYYHNYLKEWFSAETSTRIDGVTHWMFVPGEGGEK